MSAFMGMVVPAAGILLEPVPFGLAGQVAAVGAVDDSLIEMSPVEVLAELARQHNVGVEVENPAGGADLVEAALNHPRLVELAVPPVVLGQDMVN